MYRAVVLHVRFPLLSTVSFKVATCLDVTPCSLVDVTSASIFRAEDRHIAMPSLAVCYLQFVVFMC
jgi:hypothetical protein